MRPLLENVNGRSRLNPSLMRLTGQRFSMLRTLLTAPTPDHPSYTWEHMTHLLQEKLKPNHVRLLDIGGQLKKLKQRPGQSVSELVSYLETLEDQLPERPSESQKHSNL